MLFPRGQTPSLLKGDVNGDGSFNVSDPVMFQKWLLSASDVQLSDSVAADFYEAGKPNALDLSLMKKNFLKSNNFLKLMYSLHNNADICTLFGGYEL